MDTSGDEVTTVRQPEDARPSLRPGVMVVTGLALTVTAILLLQLAFARSATSTFDPGGLDSDAASRRCAEVPLVSLKRVEDGIIVDAGVGELTFAEANTSLAEQDVPLVLRVLPEPDVEPGTFLMSSNDGADGRTLGMVDPTEPFLVPLDLHGRQSAVFSCLPLT